MIDFALDAGFYIFIVTGAFAVLFLTIRFCTISSWTLVVKVTQIDTQFQSGQSWATMLSPFISVLGIALPLISGTSNENGDELQSLNFFYGLIFLISAIFYMASSRVLVFLFADALVLWSIFGTSATLCWVVYALPSFPSYAKWPILIFLPIGLLYLAYFSWTSMKSNVEDLRSKILGKTDLHNFGWLVK
jgi:hypothetical protein